MVTWVWRQNYIFDDNNVWKSCLLFPPMKDLCLIKCKCCLGGDKNLNDHCLVSSVSLANWMFRESCRSQLVAKHLIFVGKCKFNIQMSSNVFPGPTMSAMTNKWRFILGQQIIRRLQKKRQYRSGEVAESVNCGFETKPSLSPRGGRY